MNITVYPYRDFAKVVFELLTPLRIGSGEETFITDSAVLKDENACPYIPGSSIAGVLRSTFDTGDADSLFGSESTSKSSEVFGSRLIVSDARLVYSEDKTIESPVGQNSVSTETGNGYLGMFSSLPIRQHVKIGRDGISVDGGKFDEEVIYKGARFCFEMEIRSQTPCDGRQEMDELLKSLYDNDFRLGGGSRRGFGRIRSVSTKVASLDLTKPQDLDLYLDKSSSLNAQWEGWISWQEATDLTTSAGGRYKHIQLSLKPEGFFLFGSGLADEQADITPVMETVIRWNNGDPDIVEDQLLIPASSVKGAISHAVAAHYDRITRSDADKADSSDNLAVMAFFGSNNEPRRGNVLFSDIFIKKGDYDTKVLHHNALNSYTGGAKSGALFQEKVAFLSKTASPIVLNIAVDENAMKEVSGEHFEKVMKAFRFALEDLCSGLLPLGGRTNQGNGVFEGEIIKNELIWK